MQADNTSENLGIQMEGKMMEEGKRELIAQAIFYVCGASSHELVTSFCLLSRKNEMRKRKHK